MLSLRSIIREACNRRSKYFHGLSLKVWDLPEIERFTCTYWIRCWWLQDSSARGRDAGREEEMGVFETFQSVEAFATGLCVQNESASWGSFCSMSDLRRIRLKESASAGVLLLHNSFTFATVCFGMTCGSQILFRSGLHCNYDFEAPVRLLGW